MEQLLAKKGLALGICCHPYDLCTELIAREMGVIVTNAWGQPVDAPLDTTSEVDWVAYANGAIEGQIRPLFEQALQRRGIISNQ